MWEGGGILPEYSITTRQGMCGESVLAGRENQTWWVRIVCWQREPNLGEQVCMKISLEHTRTLSTWPHHRLPYGVILALHMTRTIMYIHVTINWRLAQHEKGPNLFGHTIKWKTKWIFKEWHSQKKINMKIKYKKRSTDCYNFIFIELSNFNIRIVDLGLSVVV